MKKIFSFFAALMATTVMAFATEIAVPETVLDLQDPTMVTTAGWTGEVAYYLDDDVLITSGQESRQSTAKQTWITFSTTGSSNSTWDALAPFKGSDYYTNKAYATLQAGRYTAYLVTGCDSVWLYGKNNSTSKYLRMNIYDVTGSSATTLDDATVDPTYAVSNTATTDPMVLKQELDAAKTYLIVTTGVGSSNSRVFEIAFFRNPGATPKTYWTVAGSSATLFGTTWDPANKANNMVKQEDGSYKWEKTELELAAGEIAFKVCKDHAWTEAYPASDYKLPIDEAGIYTITITFEPENENKVSAVATKTGEAVVLPTVVLHGNFSGDWKDTDPFAPAENKETAELTLSLKKGTYEFGFKFDGAWKANGANITRAENTANLSTGSGNMHITADEEGDYVFTYTFETQGLVVAYPAKTIPEDYEAIFAYNGKGTTKAEEVIYEGGTLTAYGYGQPGPEGMNSNMTYNSSQKGNMTIKIGKGYHKNAEGEGYYFMAITLDKALEEGDLLQVAAFRTGATDCVFGMDFNVEADSAAATDECQYLFENNLQILSSNGVPTDEVIDIPACAVGAKYIRLYRKSGSTGLYIANFSVFRKKGGEPEKEYELKNCWDDGEWMWKATVKDGDDYKLENVVFGGQGVNWREVGSATDGTWVPVADFLGDNTIAKFDTVTLALNPTAGTITATLIGKYIDPTPADPTAAVIGSMTEWATQIPFELSEDKKKATLIINDIPAGDYEFKMIINGEWRSNGYTYHRDFPGAAGITGNADDNMIFKADIAGTYTFEWYFENDSLAFIFPEKPEPTDPTAAVMGSFNDWSEEIPFELSLDKKFATLYNDNIKPGTYYFKMIINGEWRSNGYEFHRDFPGAAGISGDSEENMSVYIDVEGAYLFEWYFENDSLAIKFPAKPESGYYLMGSFNDWAIAAENLFQSNLEAEGEEFVLSINLTAGDEIKVAYVMAGHTMEWFPKEDNYTVDANHAGPTTMYFRPEYNDAWAAFGGYFYIVPTSTEGIEEILSEGKAVKIVREGNLIILKGDKAYNAMGQIVK